MRAYSMDLRERALLDSDAGMKAADVAPPRPREAHRWPTARDPAAAANTPPRPPPPRTPPRVAPGVGCGPDVGRGGRPETDAFAARKRPINAH